MMYDEPDDSELSGLFIHSDLTDEERAEAAEWAADILMPEYDDEPDDEPTYQDLLELNDLFDIPGALDIPEDQVPILKPMKWKPHTELFIISPDSAADEKPDLEPEHDAPKKSRLLILPPKASGTGKENPKPDVALLQRSPALQKVVQAVREKLAAEAAENASRDQRAAAPEPHKSKTKAKKKAKQKKRWGRER